MNCITSQFRDHYGSVLENPNVEFYGRLFVDYKNNQSMVKLRIYKFRVLDFYSAAKMKVERFHVFHWVRILPSNGVFLLSFCLQLDERKRKNSSHSEAN